MLSFVGFLSHECFVLERKRQLHVIMGFLFFPLFEMRLADNARVQNMTYDFFNHANFFAW